MDEEKGEKDQGEGLGKESGSDIGNFFEGIGNFFKTTWDKIADELTIPTPEFNAGDDEKKTTGPAKSDGVGLHGRCQSNGPIYGEDVRNLSGPEHNRQKSSIILGNQDIEIGDFTKKSNNQ